MQFTRSLYDGVTTLIERGFCHCEGAQHPRNDGFSAVSTNKRHEAY